MILFANDYYSQLKNQLIVDLVLIKLIVAGWSSSVARQAHNLKVVGSNPAPATNILVIDILQHT